jgi:hypothetical protein
MAQLTNDSRRLATPGGSLEQDSHIVPIPSSQNQKRDSYHEDHHHPRHQYRRNVDEEDRVVVDWQHHRGYSTKRGTTPTAASISTQKQQRADPWGPDGLLTLLTKSKPHPPEKIDESSIIEKSLVSDSLLMFLEVPPPSRGGGAGGGRNNRSAQRAPSLEIHSPRRELNSMNSPLTSFVNSHSQRHHREVTATAAASPSKVKSPHRSVIPLKYDPRLSDDQLERLISQSKSHLVTNLLLENDEQQLGSSSLSAHDLLLPPSVYVDPSRPLTSAGRKLTSRG